MRTLIVIPIIHAEQDMGSLLEQVKQAYVQRYGPAKWDEHLKTVREVWTGIRRLIEALELPYTSVRLYQDGLPDFGREEDIVREVAAQGSENHQLLLALMEKGATLMGTEDPHLLLQEYQLLQGALGGEGVRSRLSERPKGRCLPAARQAGAQTTPDPLTRGHGDAADDRSRKLLAERDQYIAKRINSTLRAGEIGLLFLGLAHSVEPLLDTDILVQNLLPGFRSPGTNASLA